jgi:hypothetical protein
MVIRPIIGTERGAIPVAVSMINNKDEAGGPPFHREMPLGTLARAVFRLPHAQVSSIFFA